MNLFSIAGLFCGIFCAILALISFIFGKAKIHRVLTLFNVCVAVWGFGYFIVGSATSEAQALFGWRFSQVGGNFIAVCFYHITYLFCGFNRRLQLILVYAWGLFFLFFCFFTNSLFAKTQYIYGLHYNDATWFYKILMVSWVAVVCFSFIELVRFLPKTTGVKRTQTLYIIIGFLTGFVGGTSTLLPMVGIHILPYGTFSIPVYCLIVTYAILKHQLLGVDVIVKKTLVFAGISTLILGSIGIATFLLQDVLGKYYAIPRALSFVIGAIVFVALYEPVKKLLVNATDRYLFQKKYDPRQILRSFVDYAATVLDLDKIVSGTIELLEKIFHPKGSTILLLNGNKDGYASYGEKDESKALSIENSSQILEYLKSTKSILSMEAENDKNVNEKIKSEMLNLKAALAIPLLLRDELIGIILLGKKKSDEYYSIDDLTMLMDLARTLAIAINNSISHSLLLESQKKQAQSERLISMGYLVTNLSHEIRNPINNIRGAVEAALDVIDLELKDIPDEKRQKSLAYVVDRLNDAVEKSDKANTVFNSILNIMKIDKAKFVSLSIKKIIDVVISRIEPYIKHTNIRVVNLISENFPQFKGDEIIIEQVFFNLINNAVQAIEMAKKGDRVQVKALDLGEKVRIEVEDNGCGIPKYDIERIFEPFYTTKDNLHVYATGKSKGIGVGLMIAHHIVTAHDGTITVESEEGKGATFIVDIPKEIKIEKRA